LAEIKAVVHFGENECFIGISPGFRSSIMETNGDRASAATPIGLKAGGREQASGKAETSLTSEEGKIA
jgi:hypothetical protein